MKSFKDHVSNKGLTPHEARLKAAGIKSTETSKMTMNARLQARFNDKVRANKILGGGPSKKGD